MHPFLNELKKILPVQPTIPASILMAIRSRIEFKAQVPNRIGRVFKDGNKGVLVVGKAGTSKAQPLYSKILTPSGWIIMSSIKIGDVVCCPDGTTSNVLGIYPQGRKDIFRITFSDDSTVDCTLDHLWKVDDRQKLGGHGTKIARKNNSLGNVYTTEFMKSKLIQKNGDKRFSIPTIKCANFYSQDISIDPYVLGCLIGDGGLSRPRRISFTSADKEIIDRVQSKLENGYFLKYKDRYDYYLGHGKSGIKNKYIVLLKEMGLFGIKSDKKFIPECYLFNSKEVRLALLQGLMDTDGTVDRRTGMPSFSTVSYKLAQNIKTLVYSLGGMVSITKNKSHYVKNNKIIECKDVYICMIKYNNSKDLFTLSRKKDIVKNRTIYFTKRIIRKIKKIGYEECQCILIDHPEHLYITDNFISTHNTRTLRKIYDGLELETINSQGKMVGKWMSSSGSSTAVGVYETLETYHDSIIFLDEFSLDSPNHVQIIKQVCNGEIVRQKHDSIEPVKFTGMLVCATNAIKIPSVSAMEHLLATLDRFFIVKATAPKMDPIDYLERILADEHEESIDWGIIKRALKNQCFADLNEAEKKELFKSWNGKAEQILDPTRAQWRNAHTAHDIFLFVKRMSGVDDITKEPELLEFARKMVDDCIIFNPVNLLWLTPIEEVVYKIIEEKITITLQEILAHVESVGMMVSIRHVHNVLNKMITNRVICRPKHGSYSIVRPIRQTEPRKETESELAENL